MSGTIQQPQPPGTAAARDFPRMLEQSKGEIAKVLPEGINIERVLRMALTAYKVNSDIRDCTPISILTAVMRAAELGLEPGGGLKQCWLIPYRNTKKNIRECQFQIGFQGVLELARRTGIYRQIDARVVLDTDVFSLEYTPRPNLIHRPDLNEHGAEIGVYSFAILSNGESVVEWMSRRTVEQIRKCSKDDSFWQKWWGEKAKNAVLKRMLKRQPHSVLLRSALEEDNDEAESQGREQEAAHVQATTAGGSRAQDLGRRLSAPTPAPESEAPAEVPPPAPARAETRPEPEGLTDQEALEAFGPGALG